MYARQKTINEKTVSLSAFGVKNFSRVEKLATVELAQDQKKLADDAGTCLHILEEEGTTIVFPRILGQLGEDMRLVTSRLKALQVGALTQTMQNEILTTLDQLIQAVKQMQQENQQQQQQQRAAQQQDGNSPLLPTSAELKLLKASQLRVNTRTEAIENARKTKEESPEVLQRTVEATADRQAQCAEIANEMRERINKE